MVTRRLPEHAVKLPHLGHGQLWPTVGSDDSLDLFSNGRNGRNPFRPRSEIIQDVCEALVPAGPCQNISTGLK